MLLSAAFDVDFRFWDFCSCGDLHRGLEPQESPNQKRRIKVSAPHSQIPRMLRRTLIAIVTLAVFGVLAATSQKAATSSANPVEAARLNNLGAAYMNQQLFEKGLKAFQEAAALDPDLQVAALNQGVALLNLTRIDPAKALLETAVKKNPRDPHAWFSLGLLY